MSEKLTPKLVRKLYPEQNSKEVEKLLLSKQGLTEVGDISTLRNLKRLDLAENSIQDTSFAANCTGLKWLSLAHNPVSNLRPLGCLNSLQVLNVGHAKLVGKVKVGALTSLGALILNNNALTSISGLKEVKGLNTLVLKNNAFTTLGASLHHCTALNKLSMAHNQLSDLGASLQGCTALRELRLNHNALTALPQGLSACSQLRIMDLAGNPIPALQPIKVLAQLPNLQNLTLEGCPLAEQPGYSESVRELLPQLQILDSQRLSIPGNRSKQPGSAAKSAADASVPRKRSKHPSVNSDAARGMEESTATKAGAQLKTVHSSKHDYSSGVQVASHKVSEQGPKRKHAESVSAAPESVAGRQHQTGKEPGKQRKKIRLAGSPTAEAMPASLAGSNREPTIPTSKAKAKSTVAPQVNLSAEGSYPTMPKPKLGKTEVDKRAGQDPAFKASHSSGAEATGRVTTATDAKPVAKVKGSKPQNAVLTAPTQKSAKQPASKDKQRPRTGNHAFATGRQAALLLQQEVVGNPIAWIPDPAWSWAASGQQEAPLSTWS